MSESVKNDTLICRCVPDLRKGLEAVAAREGVSLAVTVRRALTDFVAQQKGSVIPRKYGQNTRAGGAAT